MMRTLFDRVLYLARQNVCDTIPDSRITPTLQVSLIHTIIIHLRMLVESSWLRWPALLNLKSNYVEVNIVRRGYRA